MNTREYDRSGKTIPPVAPPQRLSNRRLCRNFLTRVAKGILEGKLPLERAKVLTSTVKIIMEDLAKEDAAQKGTANIQINLVSSIRSGKKAEVNSTPDDHKYTIEGKSSENIASMSDDEFETLMVEVAGVAEVVE